MSDMQHSPAMLKHQKTISDPTKDDVNRLDMTGSREPHITLDKLNRLKKIRANKQVELAKRQKFLKVIYGKPSGDDG